MPMNSIPQTTDSSSPRGSQREKRERERGRGRGRGIAVRLEARGGGREGALESGEQWRGAPVAGEGREVPWSGPSGSRHSGSRFLEQEGGRVAPGVSEFSEFQVPRVSFFVVPHAQQSAEWRSLGRTTTGLALSSLFPSLLCFSLSVSRLLATGVVFALLSALAGLCWSYPRRCLLFGSVVCVVV
ncbi:hypothetical protein M758_3G166900 [Ceratodon purpureus]|nr:hypothetical protein M758_3G166900 [Ceratodon purpureus]